MKCLSIPEPRQVGDVQWTLASPVDSVDVSSARIKHSKNHFVELPVEQQCVSANGTNCTSDGANRVETVSATVRASADLPASRCSVSAIATLQSSSVCLSCIVTAAGHYCPPPALYCNCVMSRSIHRMRSRGCDVTTSHLPRELCLFWLRVFFLFINILFLWCMYLPFKSRTRKCLFLLYSLVFVFFSMKYSIQTKAHNLHLHNTVHTEFHNN